jgi:hypothetical protein
MALVHRQDARCERASIEPMGRYCQCVDQVSDALAMLSNPRSQKRAVVEYERCRRLVAP